MKKLWTILLTVVVLLSVAVPAIAAQGSGGTASTMRLEESQGTVVVKNASGKTLTKRDGMRLYSGYTISTGKASYAYISLDETKAVKLDASSCVELTQAGKKLEITLKSGNVLFDVTSPVKSDESLSIRTSTMITGVRGTTGWVKIVDGYTAQFSLLEGALDITRTDPLTGEKEQVPLSGGQTITVVFEGVGQGFDPSLVGGYVDLQTLIDSGVIQDENIVLHSTGMAVEELQEENVPGFVAVEVAANPELQEKIAESTGLAVEEIIADAEDRLKEAESSAQEQDQAIQAALKDLTGKQQVEPKFDVNYEDIPYEEFKPWGDVGSGDSGDVGGSS